MWRGHSLRKQRSALLRGKHQRQREVYMSKNYTIGLVGLGVMGRSLALNFSSRKISVSSYNRSSDLPQEFLRAAEESFIAITHDLAECIARLERPRKVLLMVPAGQAVDAVLSLLGPLLRPGDVIIDGGNSYFRDTERRQQDLQGKGISFLGLGVSGGEEGALRGPSLMPGGARDAYESVRLLLEPIAAVGNGPCVSYMGEGGAGHFVKMVHNGIEYGIMQLIAEIYDVLRSTYGQSPQQMSAIFSDWNATDLESYLLEITATVLQKHDDEDPSGFLVDSVRDAAGSKGTGRWTISLAHELGIAVPIISAAFEARAISANQELRTVFQAGRPTDATRAESLSGQDLERIRAAFAFCFSTVFREGLYLIESAAREYSWSTDLAEVCRVWQAGCIIRAKVLENLWSWYQGNDTTVFADPHYQAGMETGLEALISLCSVAYRSGIAVPSLSGALNHVLALRRERLPQNLIQAQRDLFGAHEVERLDRPGRFHYQWSE